MGRRKAARRGATRAHPGQADLRHRARGAALTLYLDTSALLKIYVDEGGSDLVRGILSESSLAGTSTISYVEARSALGRRRRAGDLSAADHRRIATELDADWDRWVRVEVTERLVRDAGRLAEAHRLRAYDAIHLASALVLRARVGGQHTFASWDDVLDAAARREGFRLLRPLK